MLAGGVGVDEREELGEKRAERERVRLLGVGGEVPLCRREVEHEGQVRDAVQHRQDWGGRGGELKKRATLLPKLWVVVISAEVQSRVVAC
jgi:hypothetical protein